MSDEQQWELRRVNHLAVVDTYYGGRMRVKAASLQIPQKPYFQAAATSANQKTQQKANRKRKRELVRQEELIAAGKFVPLDGKVKSALVRTYRSFQDEGGLADIVPVFASGGDGCGCGIGQDAQELLQLSSEKMYSNDTGDIQVARMSDSESVLLPAESSFVLSDVRSLKGLPLGRFKLIVMDPPWENKSVGRSKTYSTFHHTELLKIDIPSVADRDECVLGIWVTNRPQYTTFLLETLLPRWGFSYHDTWYWLKLCMNGDLVTPMESTHRLPFEKMVVAHRCSDPVRREALANRLGINAKVVLSIPLRHSWKPPPECFFDESVVGGDARRVEFFARELRPQWTSIGNEVMALDRSAIHLHKCANLFLPMHLVMRQVLKFQAASLFDCASGSGCSPKEKSTAHE